MPTTAATFFGVSTNNDYTDPGGGDLRKFDESSPAGTDETTIASFGTSGGNKDIIWDPFTTRTTSGTTGLDTFGWTVDLDSTEGMGATTGSAHRLIYAGNWTIEGFATADPAAALNAVTIHATIYKRNSDGSRTQVGTGSDGLGLLSTAGSAFSITIDPGEMEFADNETFIIAYHVNGSSQIGGLDVALRIGSSIGSQHMEITLPGGGVEWRYFETGSRDAILTQTIDPLAIAKTVSRDAILEPSATRAVVASRTINTETILTPTVTKALTLNAITATILSDFSDNNQLQICIPTNRIPTGGGSTTVLITSIFD